MSEPLGDWVQAGNVEWSLGICGWRKLKREREG